MTNKRSKYSNKNNPAVELIRKVIDNKDKNRISATYILNKTPYIKVSAGIMNIFKIVRVDVVKRLTYPDHPEVTQRGIRTRVKIDF